MRAVLFDVDGVLVHSLFHADASRRRRWDQHLLEDLGVSPDRLGGFFRSGFDDVIEGRRSIVEALDRYLPEAGFKGSTLDFLTYWFDHDEHLNLQVLDIVKALRATGVRTFIATNQEHLRAMHLWRHVGLRHHFEDIFYAARLGVGKTSPGFYRLVDIALGPQAEPPLFFDDSAKVVQVASGHGWEAVLFSEVDDCVRHPWIAGRLQQMRDRRVRECPS